MASFRISDCTLLGKALQTFRCMRDIANINFSSSGVSIIGSHSLDPSIAVLKINPSGCEHFHCNESGTLGIDVKDLLRRCEAHYADECSVSLHIYADKGEIEFYFEGNLIFKKSAVTLEQVSSKADFLKRPAIVGRDHQSLASSRFVMKTTGIDDNLLPMNSLPGTYQVTIGVPSEDFRSIFRHGIYPTVDLSVRSSQVLVNLVSPRGSMEFVLRQENEDCTIERAIGEEPANFMVTLCSIDSLAEASTFTDTVLIHLDDTEPLLLNFPLGSLGSFMFVCLTT